MSIYAIADLHLSFDETVDKPMDIYGGVWVEHAENLKKNWEETISGEDTVLIPGDISWALKFSQAVVDLDWLHALPGKKILLKGNHDLWWGSIGKLNKLYDDVMFIQNNFYEAEGYAICGSRGWVCPGDDDFTEHDSKIYLRELLRLEASLQAAKASGAQKILGIMHFPPTNDKQQRSGFTMLFEKYGAEQVRYGHLHGEEGFRNGISGVLNSIEYKLVSLDYLKCMPLKIV